MLPLPGAPVTACLPLEEPGRLRHFIKVCFCTNTPFFIPNVYTPLVLDLHTPPLRYPTHAANMRTTFLQITTTAVLAASAFQFGLATARPLNERAGEIHIEKRRAFPARSRLLNEPGYRLMHGRQRMSSSGEQKPMAPRTALAFSPRSRPSLHL